MQPIFNFIKASYPQALGFFIGGSYIKGRFDQFSDYDVTVITEGNSKHFQCSVYEDRKIDFCLWGIENLNSTLSHLDLLNPQDQELAYLIKHSSLISQNKDVLVLKRKIPNLDRDLNRKIGIKAFSIINQNKLLKYFQRKDYHRYLQEICELNTWISIFEANLASEFYSGTTLALHPELFKIQNLNLANVDSIKKATFKIRNEICTSLNSLILTKSNLEAPKLKMPKPFLISSSSTEAVWNPPFTGFMA